MQDGVSESNETVEARISANNLVYQVGSPNKATVSIIDAPKPTVTLSVADPDAYEETPLSQNTNGAPKAGRFLFSRTGSTANPLTVSFSASGTATRGVDYSVGVTPLTATIPAGSSTLLYSILPAYDLVDPEGDETVVFTLDSSTGGAYLVSETSNSGTVLIHNALLSTVGVQVFDSQAKEQVGSTHNTAVFKLTRTGLLTHAVTVSYAFTGTAQSSDYESIASSVTFAVGESEKTLIVDPILDTLVEGDESVILTLIDGPDYHLGAVSQGTITIVDAPPPTLQILCPDFWASEDLVDGQLDLGEFIIQRSSVGLANPVAVTLGLYNSASAPSASLANDYVGFPNLQQNSDGTFTALFAANQSSISVPVRALLDNYAEGVEVAGLQILPRPGYLLGTYTNGQIYINDAPQPQVSIAVEDSTAKEEGNNPGRNPESGSIRISRTGNLSIGVQVNLGVSSASPATLGQDFTLGNTTSSPALSVWIPAGETSILVPVNPVWDDLVEGSNGIDPAIPDCAPS